MTGMDRSSGAVLSGTAHIVQSLTDLLTTPLGSRVMRRDYGSLLFELIDRPLNAATRLLCTMAIGIAVARWEPRISVSRIALVGDYAGGTADVTIDAILTEDAGTTALTRLTIPLRN